MGKKANPYLRWITYFDEWARAGRDLPLGGLALSPPPKVKLSAGKVLLFSPHPDDECITGALPLRLSREAGIKVVNIAVTLGSNVTRQVSRWDELQQACAFLGWPVECVAQSGQARITLKARANEPARWREAVVSIQEVIGRHQPQLIIFPHATDYNETHIGTHALVMDALLAMPLEFCCGLIETEFWGAMSAPNLMVESSIDDVAELVAALSCHVGEVQRNPYHLTLASWMQDNVRRGGEIVGGQGGMVPDYRFATLYRVKLWRDGVSCEIPEGSTKFVSIGKHIMKQWMKDVLNKISCHKK